MAKPKRDIDLILDIPLTVTVEMGRTRLLVNEIMQFGQGTVIELNRLAGEPLDLYVGGKLVATGETVVKNEQFAFKVLDIISPEERIKTLGL